MSKESPQQQQQQQQSEEVDLAQLFKLIGNAFDRFFKFISSIFSGIYKVLILLLLHIYRRVIWYGLAIVLGFVIGFFLDKGAGKIYGANMFIETNFNSARQVYENIKQFHQLAYVDKDTLELAKRLNITSEEASHLKGFYIETDLDENNIASMYSGFYMKLDSLSRLEMTYDRYKESLTAYNFPIHKIGVSSNDRNIYKKIEESFVDQISSNDYLKEMKLVNDSILNKKDRSLRLQVEKIDSLVKEYLKIRMNESKKEQVVNSSTNVYMGDAESEGGTLIVDESKVLEQRLEYENMRRSIDSTRAIQKNIINIIANFPESGYDIRGWRDKKKFVLPIASFLLTLLVFSFIGLGKFLDYQSKRQ